MKLTSMQRKFLVKAALVLLLFAGCFFVLWASSGAANAQKECTESLEESCKKGDTNSSSGEMIWETLSHQFFSATEISN